VHGSVVTVVGQNSMPVSTAIRSLRQNSSFWFRRRAVASNLPSSKDPFLVAIVPPKNRVGDAVTRQFESRTFEMLVFPARSAPSSKVGIFGTAGPASGTSRRNASLLLRRRHMNAFEVRFRSFWSDRHAPDALGMSASLGKRRWGVAV